MLVNVALAKAILDSRKKKQTVARLARLKPWQLSKVLNGTLALDDKQRERLAGVLQVQPADIFPEVVA